MGLSQKEKSQAVIGLRSCECTLSAGQGGCLTLSMVSVESHITRVSKKQVKKNVSEIYVFTKANFAWRWVSSKFHVCECANLFVSTHFCHASHDLYVHKMRFVLSGSPHSLETPSTPFIASAGSNTPISEWAQGQSC